MESTGIASSARPPNRATRPLKEPEFLTDRLGALRTKGQFRQLPAHRTGVDFWSNDYLGFAGRISATAETEHIAPGSRLISGNHAGIERLEQDIASFHGFPAALLFGSGYTANLGLLSCVARRTDTVIYDEFIHASLRDGIRLSGATGRRSKHNDLEDVAALLRRAAGSGNVFVVTESRFSMDGDTAPLAELAALCAEWGAHLIVDEAHSTGLDGTMGRGLVAHLELQDLVFATVATYGKAPGFHGSAILGSTALREYLINFSRPFIFTTGPRPAQIAGLRSVYTLLQNEQPEAYRRLSSVIEAFKRFTSAHLPEVRVQSGPIQWVSVPGNDEVMSVEAAALAAGYLVKGIRSPSVPAGSERIRICLHAYNTPEEVAGMIATLEDAVKQIS